MIGCLGRHTRWFPFGKRVIYEAAAYTGIGTAKLREISDSESCDFVLWIGTKRLLKRKKLKEYLDNAFSI